MIKFTTTNKEYSLTNLPSKFYVLVDDKINKALLYNTLEEQGYTWVVGQKPTEFKPSTLKSYYIFANNQDERRKKSIFWRNSDDTKDLHLDFFYDCSPLFASSIPPQNEPDIINNIKDIVTEKVDLPKIVNAIKTLKVLNAKPCKLTTKGSEAPLYLNITSTYDLIILSSGANNKQGRVIIHYDELHSNKVFNAIVDVMSFTNSYTHGIFELCFDPYFLIQDTGE